MTRDEQRKACIEAMAKAVFGFEQWDWDLSSTYVKEEYVKQFTAAFDALHGTARVCPVEATDEMATGYLDAQIGGYHPGDCKIIFRAMSAIADLTNPPEKKP